MQNLKAPLLEEGTVYDGDTLGRSTLTFEVTEIGPSHLEAAMKMMKTSADHSNITIVGGDVIADQQRRYGGGLDRDRRGYAYSLIEDYPIAQIKIPSSHLNAVKFDQDAFAKYFVLNTINSAMSEEDKEELLEDLEEDLKKIHKLIDRYRSGEEVYPVVLDRQGCLIDGFHRLAALNALSYTKTGVYRQLAKMKL